VEEKSPVHLGSERERQGARGVGRSKRERRKFGMTTSGRNFII
jgi:hypothetical protein